MVNNDLKSKKILLAHSNDSLNMRFWHEQKCASARNLGYNLSLFNMAKYINPTMFPDLDRMWKKRAPALMKLYDFLGPLLDNCDIFIHYNGALIHPAFLAQFSCVKIYHCADDPDASKNLSKPVAKYYDMCAISNPACIDMYKSWGGKEVFFWPLGAFHYQEEQQVNLSLGAERDIPLIYIGSKYGVANMRFIGRFLGLYKKKKFMNQLEKKFPALQAYGYGWGNAWIADELVPEMYSRSRIGVNIHNSLGPINGRLYDLAAFGVCQICDNKSNLNFVYEEGKEIIGFEKPQECFELIRYYKANPLEAEQVALAGRERFLRDYTMAAIWERFFLDVSQVLIRKLTT